MPHCNVNDGELTDRAKSVISIVAGGILVALTVAQWLGDAVWFVTRGSPGITKLSVGDGWWLLAVEGFLGLVGVVLGICGFITDNWPPSWAG